MVQKGYPKEVEEFTHDKLGVWLNCAVWDIPNGTILKLGEGRVITHGLLGFEKLSAKRLCRMYGDPPVFRNLLWPDTPKLLDSEDKAHWTFINYEECCRIPVVCQVVQLMRDGIIRGKTYK